MAIAVDATSNATNQQSTTPLQWNHTCSGTNRVLVVFVFSRSATAPSLVTYNGVAMTQAIFNNAGGGGFGCSIWTLVAPATGTNQISVSWASSPTDAYGGAISFTGAAQSTPVDGTGSTNLGNFQNVSVTTSFNNSFVVASDFANNGNTLTSNGGQTSIFNTTISLNATYAAAYKQQITAGTATLGWTGSSNDQLTAIGVKEFQSTSIPNKVVKVPQAVNRSSNY